MQPKPPDQWSTLDTAGHKEGLPCSSGSLGKCSFRLAGHSVQHKALLRLDRSQRQRPVSWLCYEYRQEGMWPDCEEYAKVRVCLCPLETTLEKNVDGRQEWADTTDDIDRMLEDIAYEDGQGNGGRRVTHPVRW